MRDDSGLTAARGNGTHPPFQAGSSVLFVLSLYHSRRVPNFFETLTSKHYRPAVAMRPSMPGNHRAYLNLPPPPCGTSIKPPALRAVATKPPLLYSSATCVRRSDCDRPGRPFELGKLHCLPRRPERVLRRRYRMQRFAANVQRLLDLSLPGTNHATHRAAHSKE